MGHHRPRFVVRLLPVKGFTLLVMFLALPTFAACKEGLVFFPTPGAVVPINSKLYLEALGQEQKRVVQLVGSSALSLASNDDVIPVNVQSAFTSSRGRIAVKLTPARNLKPKREYHLVGLGLAEILNAGRDGTPKWSTSAVVDTTGPLLKVKPAVSEGSALSSKEGGSRVMRVHAVLEEPSASYFVVTVQRQRGEKKQQQYLAAFDGTGVSVSDDACFGPFELESGVTYRLSLSIFDAAGNKSRESPVLVGRAP